MRILLTNDDGISAPGLKELARAFAAEFPDVAVVAPAVDFSGVGTSVNHGTSGAGGPRPRPERLPGLDRIPAHSVDGPPALAVLLAFAGACGPVPDLVVSGINSGPNIGVGILHSGTVGAALTAAGLGVPALAVSLDNHWHLGPHAVEQSRPRHWETASAVAVELLPALQALRREPAVLNVNVPDVPTERLRERRAAAVAPVGVLDLVERGGSTILDMRPATAEPPGGRATDAELLLAGHVTVTSLRLAETSLWAADAVPAAEPVPPVDALPWEHA
ncbi:5'/3'-nucleotidase SurE [Streptomyces antimycoticus]|uniref:5'/3'-nucleotidase SurE n=1 Tax=Streptomyces antimycoticus TaxID=68175 RepID=UPI000A38B686|nr:5'/3'-nucleotidase SurE [Streptomyces antimycoticus]